MNPIPDSLASFSTVERLARLVARASSRLLAHLVARVSGSGSASLASWPSLSAMSMTLSELETTFVIKFIEKELLSGYLMIIAKVFESVFELSNANVKFKVLND